MKYLLVICFLLILYVNTIPGGWEKGSFRENDMGIDQAFRKAFELYSNDNSNSEIDYTERLTIYRQIADCINYRMCFIDLKSDLNVVQEYIISGPEFGTSKKNPTFQLFEKNTYKSKGFLSVGDSKYTKVENTLKSYVKYLKQNILYITKVEIIEAYLDNFYIVTARTDEDKHIYVVGQSKENTDNYEALGMLK